MTCGAIFSSASVFLPGSNTAREGWDNDDLISFAERRAKHLGVRNLFAVDVDEDESVQFSLRVKEAFVEARILLVEGSECLPNSGGLDLDSFLPRGETTKD